MEDGSGDAVSRRTEKLIRRAKKAARSELKHSEDWYKGVHYKCTLGDGFDDLPKTIENIDRVHCDSMTAEEFREKYERPNLPCVIDGLTEGTRAQAEWTGEGILKRFRHVKFKCGEDDDGYSVKLKMKHFMRYEATDAKTDDSPLYVFHSRFGEDDVGKTLLDDYRVPPWFDEDLFQLAGEKRRPPYRWFVMGPQRSGSGIHTDPLATSAWNMLLQGHKRWVLFEPETDRHLLKSDYFRGVDSEAISWFKHILPSTIERGLKRWDFVQRPGETVFVPGGWWHTVLNLDETIAVTQNFASSSNFREVWKETAKSRPRLAAKWLTAINEHGGYPRLNPIAMEHLHSIDKDHMLPRGKDGSEEEVRDLLVALRREKKRERKMKKERERREREDRKKRKY